MINHPFFTDDIIIFYKVDVETNIRIQKLLHIFDQASNQLINSKKIVMVLSRTP